MMMTLKTAAIVLGIKLILVINKDDEGIKTEDSVKYIDQDDDDDDGSRLQRLYWELNWSW